MTEVCPRQLVALLKRPIHPEPVKFRKRLSVAFPPVAQRPGDVSAISVESLNHEEALKVDCPDVEKNVFDGDFGSPAIDRFVVIQSPETLDVQTVMMMATADGAGGSSIDVERHFSRRIDLRKPNLQAAPALPTPAETGLPEGFPGVLFCVPNPKGGTPDRISALIRNDAPVPVEASVARAAFGIAGSVDAEVGPLDPNGEQAVEFAIPRGCFGAGFSADCEFEVTTDDPDEISESAEGDNVTSGFCVTAAG